MVKVSPGTVKNRLKSLQIEYYSSHRLSKMSIHNLQRSLLKSSEFLKSSLSIKHFIIRRFWFMKNTALRAGNSNSRTITFKNKEHEKFYTEYLEKCRYQDVYHQALVYCLGIDRDTRNNVNKIYNFKTGCVKTECLQEGWQTSGSLRIVRMAFNLYCNGTPSVGDYETEEDQLKECQYYTVEDLFCCGYARYFWEAIKIRYPEYCLYKDWEDMYAEN